jgi:hypothetical protein
MELEMREKFVIYQRQAKPRSAALQKAKTFAAVVVLGMLGVAGMHLLYAPAQSATSTRGDQSQASNAPKQLFPQAAEPMSVALAANSPPVDAIDNGPAMGSDARSENRTEIAAPPQSRENATQPATEQRSVKVEKPVRPKQKVVRSQRSKQPGAYAQSTYQDPYRANASGWASAPQRPSGFFPF